MTPLHLAAERGNSKVVRILLSSGATVDPRDKRNAYTPLHLASSNSCHEAAIILLEFGADPHAESVRWRLSFRRRGRCVQRALSSGRPGGARPPRSRLTAGARRLVPQTSTFRRAGASAGATRRPSRSARRQG